MNCSRCVCCCRNRRWCCCCKNIYRLCGIPYFKIVFLLLVVTMVSIVYACVNIPFSPLFKSNHKEEDILNNVKKENEYRLEKALKYFQELDNKTSVDFYRERSGLESSLVVCIVTVSRTRQTAKTGYLIQTAAAVDRIIKTDTFFKNAFLFVCNVDKDPLQHKDAVMLQNYIPYLQKNGSNFWNRTFSIANVSLHNKIIRRGQETADYTFCLNASYSFRSPFVMMLEDDVVPYDNIFEVVHYKMRQHNLLYTNQNTGETSGRRNFSFLKLYYPERWQGFANEADRIIELISLGVFSGGVLYAVFSLCTLMCKTDVSYRARLFYYCLFSLVSIFAAVIYGRQNVLDLRRLSTGLFKFAKTPACCTPAMFYSAHIIPDLIPYVLAHSELNKDLAIYNFTLEHFIPGFIIEPNLVRHIGMYTSLEDSHKSPYEFV